MDLPGAVKLAYDEIKFKPDYNIHIRPILSDRCFLCHGTDVKSRKAELDLSDRAKATAALPLNPSKKAIVPGNPATSELVARILSGDESWKMPPVESHRIITDHEKALLIKWIENGAEYKEHWAFIPPVDQKPPNPKEKSWIKNDIDAFVLNKLESLGWKPNSPAEKEILIRRLSLDITGLPPTLQEIDDFVLDTGQDAYARLVDRLLASEDYGENMAVFWMDLARFADTHGYTVDKYRPAWPWRDWVIKAFNENMPYDQFVTWQLAGDLIPNATKDQRLATAFNRIHAQNVEGGIVNEEFRVEYVMDRTNTFGTAFLGLTVECARCHDHKFDPFSQKDYYQLYSYFNNIEEAGQIPWDDATPVPTMLLSTPTQDSILAYIDKSIENKSNEITNLIKSNEPKMVEWVKTESKKQALDITHGLASYYSFDKKDNTGFVNELNKKEVAAYKDPMLIIGIKGQAFKTNGDDVLSFGNTGLYDRTHPFSISAWLRIPATLKQGVILYKGFGEMLYNYRGYFLNLRGNQLELTMNRTWPYNSIIKVTQDSIPRDTWFHITITYDGQSKANGFQLYINGDKTKMTIEKDNLWKGILLVNNGLPSKQPGLSFGADFRSAGIKDGAIDELRVYDYQLADPVIKSIYFHDRSLTPDLSQADWKWYFTQKHIPGYRNLEDELLALHTRKNSFIDTIPEMMVMDEMDSLRPAFILNRGLYSDPKERVYPGTPSRIFAVHDTMKQNRLALAKWLFDPKHPLTSRVLVNRMWQKFMGKGIVTTAENFGYQGTMPSHPELLDHLAIYLIKNNWDLKALQKYIVMSSTYRQSSLVSAELKSADPDNTWLARGPSRALSAEQMRDHSLASSHLLHQKIGGPSVKPYQPDGLWSLSGARYQTDTGSSLYRKSLYTFWMRTNPPPSMSIFDAPSRSYCIVRRQQTATPLQALVLLNDPQLIEAARSLAYHSILLNKDKINIISYIYRSLTCIKPSEQELTILKQLYDDQYESMKSNPAKAKGWLTAGAKRFNTDPIALASATVVANTIMNSDAYINLK